MIDVCPNKANLKDYDFLCGTSFHRSKVRTYKGYKVCYTDFIEKSQIYFMVYLYK